VLPQHARRQAGAHAAGRDYAVNRLPADGGIGGGPLRFGQGSGGGRLVVPVWPDRFSSISSSIRVAIHVPSRARAASRNSDRPHAAFCAAVSVVHSTAGAGVAGTGSTRVPSDGASRRFFSF